MTSLEQLKKYLENHYEKQRDQLSELEERKTIKIKLDEIVELLENELYTKINFENLKMIFNLIWC